MTAVLLQRTLKSIQKKNINVVVNTGKLIRIKNSPSGKTCLNFRYDVVSRIIDALSNCEVIALGKGSNFANSRNSAFSFSRRDLAAFLLFSFMAQRADKP